jgi:hypothetical protein
MCSLIANDPSMPRHPNQLYLDILLPNKLQLSQRCRYDFPRLLGLPSILDPFEGLLTVRHDVSSHVGTWGVFQCRLDGVNLRTRDSAGRLSPDDLSMNHFILPLTSDKVVPYD